jgi:hypothetical protein
MLVAPYLIDGLPDDCAQALADPKLLQTFNRSNGGAAWLDESLIVRKWARPKVLDPDVRFNRHGSAELESIAALNRQRVDLEGFIVVFILLCIVKFIVFYRKKE